MRRIVIAGALACVPTVVSAGEPFEYAPPGDLLPGSGDGLFDETVYSPGMRFPMEEGPAFANSQVYMHGGSGGPGGGQCDVENYSYPWRDNYCETRSWDMPLCPAGEGHQGQDIRPATCDANVHVNVAPAAGTITNIGTYSVYITAPDGTRYDLLHGSNNQVSSGQAVERGQRINNVSNAFGGTPTTIHTHFNISQDVAGVGFVYVSPYMSLVEGYQELFGITGGGGGAVDGTDCAAINGWAWDEEQPDLAVAVRLSFGGPIGKAETAIVEVVADQHRDDLCDALGSCEHGFSAEAPLSLRDGNAYPVYAYAIDAKGGTSAIEGSPLSFQCQPPGVPEGVRRLISSPEIIAAWNIEPFWDLAKIDDATIAAIDIDRELPTEPVIVASDADPSTVWLMDPPYRRLVDSEETAQAWGLSLADAQTWPAAVVDDVIVGTPLRSSRFVMVGSDGAVWAIDDEQCSLADCDTADDGGTAEGANDGPSADDDADGTAAGSDEGDGVSGGADGDGGGCGCRNAPPQPASLAIGLLMLVAIRRRRS